MIGFDVREAIRRYPCLEALASFARAGSGWLFVPPLVICGVECLYGVCEGPVVTETLTLRSEEDVTAVRFRTQDYLGARDLVRGVLWEYTGRLSDALGQLDELPPDGHSNAPRLLRPASSMVVMPGDRSQGCAGLLLP